LKRHLYFDGLLTVDERSLVNEGGLAEQFIGQHLLHPFQAPQLCYWLREGKSSNAEVDYVISQGNLFAISLVFILRLCRSIIFFR